MDAFERRYWRGRLDRQNLRVVANRSVVEEPLFPQPLKEDRPPQDGIAFFQTALTIAVIVLAAIFVATFVAVLLAFRSVW